MRALPILLITALIAALLAVAGCGDDDGAPAAGPQSGGEVAMTQTGATGPPPATVAGADEPPMATIDGTTITVGGSEFGRMLFDGDGLAIYIFENDPEDTTVCHGECAEAWPPVVTDGAPRAAGGVRAPLLGTIERRDGTRQVTYAGKPLYTYAHERPGEVRCRDVHLNGGLWWVVGPDGERRP